MQLIKNITWPDVYKIWQDNEIDEQKWENLYKAQGYASWQAWRQKYIEPLKLDKLNWQLFEIQKPLTEVPGFFGGPYKKWQQHFYIDKKTLSFKELAEQEKIKNHKNITDIADNFPKQTSLIGLLVNDRVYIIDGMHRCCAISLLAQQGKELNSDIIIALAYYKQEIKII